MTIVQNKHCTEYLYPYHQTTAKLKFAGHENHSGNPGTRAAPAPVQLSNSRNRLRGARSWRVNHSGSLFCLSDVDRDVWALPRVAGLFSHSWG